MSTEEYKNKQEGKAAISLEEKQKEWSEIEEYVLCYKKQFVEGATEEDILESKRATEKLLEKFNPLFKKYIMLFKTGQIDFRDYDIKIFVSTFIDDPRLHRALKRQKSKIEFRADIYKKFCFVLETYSTLDEQDILIDLQMLLLVLAKRYKPQGRNFCAYVHNCYRFEVSRHVKKFIENPINIGYKNVSYEDNNNSEDGIIETIYEDQYHEPENGVPDFSWINGETCSEVFNVLSPLERKIIVKYFAEENNDKQIAEQLGLHINTVNQKRRLAINKLGLKLGIDLTNIKRNRHSGLKKNVC